MKKAVSYLIIFIALVLIIFFCISKSLKVGAEEVKVPLTVSGKTLTQEQFDAKRAELAGKITPEGIKDTASLEEIKKTYQEIFDVVRVQSQKCVINAPNGLDWAAVQSILNCGGK